ncbi:Protein DML1 [Nakaseomyces bracarensis]|uniref:Protein DML1 n=1 Tax=Nakaseomyces bracarensis TaxID=273131 RepID=A0ABR4NZE0_9SACH
MHEVITISVSHRSNHLSTQFFNCQEALLYRGKDDKLNDAEVFLNPTIDKLSKTVSYNPRALLWDAKTGNGSLGTFQYSDSNDNDYYFNDKSNDNRADKTILTHPKIEKSAYQIALDNGTQPPKLNKENTKYWSDYSRMIYSPSSLNILNDWYHNTENPNRPDYKKLGERSFDKYFVGYEEFKNNYLQDFFDNNMHRKLEECDSLQGFNIITDMDNGWGGFTSALLTELKDDLPKNSYFTWAFHEEDPYTKAYDNKTPIKINKKSFGLVANKIRATANISENSDLFFPIFSNNNFSNWEVGSYSCLLFDSINSVLQSNYPSERKSMEYLTNCLTLGDSSRNIMSSMKVNHNEGLKNYSYYSHLPLYNRPSNFTEDNLHTFASCNIKREERHKSVSENEKEINKERKMIETELTTYPFIAADTFANVVPSDHFYEMTIKSDEKCRDVFKMYGDLVSRCFVTDDDREDLKDKLETVSSAYEYGWYDDSDSGDDNY